MIHDSCRVTGAHDTVLDCADFFFITLRVSKIPSDDVWESLYRATQNRIGIVRHEESAGDLGCQLSKVENHGKEESRSETSITKL